MRGGWLALQATLVVSDHRLPAYVTREVERALSCGDPAGAFVYSRVGCSCSAPASRPLYVHGPLHDSTMTVTTSGVPANPTIP